MRISDNFYLVKVILQNVLTCLHETHGDFLQTTPSNKSYRFTAYKQFIWFVYKRLAKANRRVLFGRLGRPFPKKTVFIEERNNFYNVLVNTNMKNKIV